MSSKEQQVIEKLLSIADKQQQSIKALAQVAQGADPEVIAYLKSAWQTAGLNAGVTAVGTPTVNFNPGNQQNGLQIGETYVITGAIPAQNRVQMDKALKAQIASQKPELDGKVSIIFNDPTTPAKSAGANMDSKKVIEKLVAIAEKQQKIINKLAQAQTGDLTQHLDPNKTPKTPARALLDALPANVRSLVVNIEAHGQDMMVMFKPGAKTQANYDVILKTLQDLTNKSLIQNSYNLKAV